MTVPHSDRTDLPPGNPPDKASSAEKGHVVDDLFREHNRALIQFLRSRLNSEADAREVAQEAYVRLLQLDKPEELSFLRAYLFKIASNLAIDHIRSRGRREQVTGEMPAFFEFPVPATQENRASARQQLELIRKAVGELPPKCRQAFLLSREENWSSAQIAQHMNLSDRMIRIYLSRALEHIRNRLDRV